MSATEVVKSGSVRAPVTEVTMRGVSPVGGNRIVPAQALRQLEALPASVVTDETATSSALLTSLQGGTEIGVLVGDSLISLTPDASEALSAILAAMLLGRGGTVRLRLSRDSATLTPEQVARELGVSRPFVYKLLDRGELPFERVGTHRRVPTEAVSEYINAKQARVALADEMAAESTKPDLVDVDLRAAARQARESGDSTPLKAALRARRIVQLARTQDPLYGGD